MWLINVKTMKLEQFFGSAIPRYAILSHTWEEEEVLFHEFELPSATEKKGYEKIRKTCSKAKRHGFEYAWVDTCCIDKRSSAELSEGINSMYQWYQDAGRCYTYLSDLEPSASSVSLEHLANCRWFERGWTLQELIAPNDLCFYDKTWTFIGNKKDLATKLESITSISIDALLGKITLKEYSIAVKMSWAANRKTTRIEDLAYCLLGIFDVGIPLLYGEGERAFVRLQEEIIRRSNDFTIFGWRSQHQNNVPGQLFAPSPASFAKCGNLERYSSRSLDIEFVLTNKGLRIERVRQFYWIVPKIDGQRQHPAGFAMCMGCDNKPGYSSYREKNTLLILRKIGPDTYLRECVARSKDIPSYRLVLHPMVGLYLALSASDSISMDRLDRPLCLELDKSFYVRKVTPESHWDHSKQLFLSPADNRDRVLAMLITVSRPGSPDVSIIAVLEARLHTPPKCYLFDQNTHSTIATWLFPHQRLGGSSHGITWKNVSEEVPEMLQFLPETSIHDGASTHVIRMSTKEGDVPQLSVNGVHFVNFSIERVQPSPAWECPTPRRSGRSESYLDRPLPPPNEGLPIHSDSRRPGSVRYSRRPLTPRDDSEYTNSEEESLEYIRREPERNARDMRFRRGSYVRSHSNERREHEEEDYRHTRGLGPRRDRSHWQSRSNGKIF
ncbi:hypothetical protein VTL71DRAFT_2445 [Oculimacula yallundae]|uniref:Heterokaryon incompatibility domain-containing protein n=1 Tax=Oculimacula yallundae TaxID=86028 RepID=A0ABR4C925_9HELO